MIIKPNDPLCQLFDLKVYVGGCEYKEVCFINTEGGFIHIMHRDKNGKIVITPEKELRMDVITGFVEVKFFYKDIDLTDRLMEGL